MEIEFKLTHEKRLDVRSVESHGDEATQYDEGPNHHPLMSKLVNEVAVRECAEESANSRGIAQSSLPGRLYAHIRMD